MPCTVFSLTICFIPFKMYVLITCCHLYPRFTVFLWKNVQFDWDKPFYVRNYRSASLFHGAGCYFRKWLQKTIYCKTCLFEQQENIFSIVVYEINSCLSEYVPVFLFNFFKIFVRNFFYQPCDSKTELK